MGIFDIDLWRKERAWMNLRERLNLRGHSSNAFPRKVLDLGKKILRHDMVKSVVSGEYNLQNSSHQRTVKLENGLGSITVYVYDSEGLFRWLVTPMNKEDKNVVVQVIVRASRDVYQEVFIYSEDTALQAILTEVFDSNEEKVDWRDPAVLEQICVEYDDLTDGALVNAVLIKLLRQGHPVTYEEVEEVLFDHGFLMEIKVLKKGIHMSGNEIETSPKEQQTTMGAALAGVGLGTLDVQDNTPIYVADVTKWDKVNLRAYLALADAVEKGESTWIRKTGESGTELHGIVPLIEPAMYEETRKGDTKTCIKWMKNQGVLNYYSIDKIWTFREIVGELPNIDDLPDKKRVRQKEVTIETVEESTAEAMDQQTSLLPKSVASQLAELEQALGMDQLQRIFALLVSLVGHDHTTEKDKGDPHDLELRIKMLEQRMHASHALIPLRQAVHELLQRIDEAEKTLLGHLMM